MKTPILIGFGLMVLGIILCALGAGGIGGALLSLAMGIGIYYGMNQPVETHYHFHGSEQQQQKQFEKIVEATEHSVEMPDGRVARVRNLKQWN